MRFLITALLVLALAVGLGLVMMREPGYVLIGYGPWSLETTLSLVLFALVAAFALLYFGLRTLGEMWRAPRRLRSWDRRRKAIRARRALDRGLLELAEGRWDAAEKRLSRRASDSDNPLINYLGAARAAQQQGAHDRRDHYLRLAHEAVPDADVAVGLTQAELQIAHRQMEQALATLNHLRSIAPRHGYVLKMLMKLYQRLGDWEHLRELLPELRKRKVLSADDADALEVRVHAALIGQARDSETLRGHWARVPRRLQSNPELVLGQALELRRLGDEVETERLLRATLHSDWDERLVDLYGRVRGEFPNVQLAAAEDWLRDHTQDPVLLLALGRIALRDELWGMARGYLEQALALQPTVEGYQLLGSLLERLNEHGEALACFRKGMALASGEIAERLPAPQH